MLLGRRKINAGLGRHPAQLGARCHPACPSDVLPILVDCRFLLHGQSEFLNGLHVGIFSAVGFFFVHSGLAKKRAGVFSNGEGFFCLTVGCHDTVWRLEANPPHMNFARKWARVAHFSAFWPLRSSRASFLQVVGPYGPHARVDEQNSMERWSDEQNSRVCDCISESAKMQRERAARAPDDSHAQCSNMGRSPAQTKHRPKRPNGTVKRATCAR